MKRRKESCNCSRRWCINYPFVFSSLIDVKSLKIRTFSKVTLLKNNNLFCSKAIVIYQSERNEIKQYPAIEKLLLSIAEKSREDFTSFRRLTKSGVANKFNVETNNDAAEIPHRIQK